VTAPYSRRQSPYFGEVEAFFPIDRLVAVNSIEIVDARRAMRDIHKYKNYNAYASRLTGLPSREVLNSTDVKLEDDSNQCFLAVAFDTANINLKRFTEYYAADNRKLLRQEAGATLAYFDTNSGALIQTRLPVAVLFVQSTETRCKDIN
jgi:hypothetical protein